MKQFIQYIFKGILLSLMLIAGQFLFAQNPAQSFILDTTETSTKSYTARDEVKMLPGFSFSAGGGNVFQAKIDHTLIFPPVENYLKSDASITLNQSEGGIVGSIPGKFAVCPSGATTYSIPIECPLGINGIQPDISLIYNSHAGNGIAGWGWNLNGISSISRSEFITFYDGKDSCVVWNNGSPLQFDGERLIKISETADSVEYRTVNESYSRIVGYNIQSWGPAYIKVYTKNGIILTFGDSQNLASYAPLYLDPETDALNEENFVRGGWSLVEIVDNNGNYMKFEYDPFLNSSVGNVLKNILYGANKIKGNASNLKVNFEYESRPDQLSGYVSGYRSLNQLRLKSVNLYVDNELQTKYNLSYSGELVSRLKSFDVFKNGKKVFNSTNFTYGEPDIAEVDTDVSLIGNYSDNTEKEKAGLSILDYDGDGINEIGDFFTENTNVGSTFYMNAYMGIHKREDNWSATTTFPLARTFVTDIGSPFTGHEYVKMIEGSSSKFGDFNGDGDMESLYSFLESGIFTLELWDRKQSNRIFQANIGYTDSLPFVSVGNYYGNTLNDVIVILNEPVFINGAYRYEYCVVAGKNNDVPFKLPSQSNAFYYLYVPKKIRSIEVANFGNANLHDDIWLTFKDNTVGILKNNQSGNNCFTSSLSFVKNFPLTILPNEIYQFADLNQDGFLDVVVRKNPDSFKVLYNEGNYSFKNQNLNIQCGQETDTLRTNYSGKGYSIVTIVKNELAETDRIYFADINQDGLLDILTGDELFRDSITSSVDFKIFDKTKWRIYFRENNDYILTKEYDSPQRAYYSTIGDAFSKGETNLIFTDLTGKLVIKDFGYGLNKNMLVKVTDGMLNEHQIEYKTLSDFTAFDEFAETETNINTNGQYINAGFHPFKTSSILLTSKTISGLSIIKYEYGKALSNWFLNGFVGFRYFETLNETTGLSTFTTNNFNTYNYQLLPHKTESYITTQKLPLNKTEYFYNGGTLGNKRFFMNTQTIKTFDYLKNTESIQNSFFDEYGNLIRSLKGIEGGFEEESLYSYKKVASWCKNVVDTTTVIKRIFNPEPDEYIRKIVSIYDSRGNVIEEVVDPGDINSVITKYKNIDVLGHPDSICIMSNGVVRTRVVKYTDSGRFVKSETDHLGIQTSYNWNERKGILTERTGVFGTTHYKYNDLLRLVETQTPDSLKATEVLRWADTNNSLGAKYYRFVESSGTASAYIWYDGYGREIQKDTYGFNNQKVSVRTEYKSNGLVDRVSEPFYDGGNVKWATKYRYDEYNRIASVTNSNNDSTTYNYYSPCRNCLFQTTITSPGDTTYTESNQIGQVMLSTKNGKVVEHLYYASGLVKATYPFGDYSIEPTPVQAEYDLQGNRTKLIDPDAGTITSKYNGFGELLWTQQDIHKANEPTITKFNYLGNGLLRSEVRENHASSGTTSDSIVYTYDSNNHYRVSQIELAGKNKQNFTYGTFDKVMQLDEDVQGKSFSFKAEYDELGRLKRYFYPTGYFTVNHYDQNGYLAGITDKNNKNIWKPNEVNALGQILKETRGDVQTSFGFDQRHQLSSIKAPGIQHMMFSINESGNIDYRIDSLNNNQREDFVFDSQNRLKTWTVTRSGQTWQNTIEYDDFGNIKSKSDLGGFTMNYGESINKPHALTSISGKPALFPNDSLNVTYTDFRKINTITEGSKSYSVLYGIDDQRRKTVYTIGDVNKMTRYYLGNYEEEIDSVGNLRKIHYLSGAVMIQDQGKDSLFFAYTDNQGSLIALVNENGNVVERYAYDPWGQRRNPLHWEEADQRKHWKINRGYTGHEHLDMFGIINMNGRVYDPLTAQFFSPDPYIQDPVNWLNYNRYTYCYNNPLRYTDPSGEVVIEGSVAVILLASSFISSMYVGTETFYAGGDFWEAFAQNFVNSVVVSLVSYAVPTAIGQAFGGVDLSSWAGVGKEILRAGAHGIGNGLVGMMQGGDFKTGFWTGVASSVTGTAVGQLIQQAGIGKSMLIPLTSGMAGAGMSWTLGGNPVSGFMQGFSIGALNHCGDHPTDGFGVHKFEQRNDAIQSRTIERIDPIRVPLTGVGISEGANQTGWGKFALGVICTDISIPDVSDAIWYKWVVYGVVGGAATISLYSNDVVRKMNREISSILQRNAGPFGFVYELRATKNGVYPNLNTGGTTDLKVGDVWKYGQTTVGESRYSRNFYETIGLKMYPIFRGNQMDILIQEKIMIYGYFFMNGHRPPGNPIFR
jgi:RHS repeat-associated protein